MSEATIENEQAEGLDTLNDERARPISRNASIRIRSILKFPIMSSISMRNMQTLETGRTPKTS